MSKNANKSCLSTKHSNCLTTEAVQSASLSLEGIDNVEGSHRLALGVLSVSDCVTDNVLKEDLQDTTGLVIDEAGDTLDTTSTGETTDSRLCNALDVVTQDFSVTLSTAFSKTFSTFTTARHCSSFFVCLVEGDNFI